MNLKVYLSLTPLQAPDNNGIGRVVHALWKYLPDYGITPVETTEQADVIACQVHRTNEPRVDVFHNHGLYWHDVLHTPYNNSHHEVNRRTIAAVKESLIVTVPSNWVAQVYRRDMRLQPVVIGHGIDFDQWQVENVETKPYILWNKNRPYDVCDPTPAWELAKRGFRVTTTFLPTYVTRSEAAAIGKSLVVTGEKPFLEMRQLILEAQIYLATTPETFGIGTLEALAAGVPVLGYDWGGTSDIVTHEVDGYLVQPGDVDGLVAGIRYIENNYTRLSEAARLKASGYTWDTVIKKYVAVYQRAYEELKKPPSGVTFIITNYNYSRWVGKAIQSVQSQTVKPAEIIVIDDGSTDDSVAVIEKHLDDKTRIIKQTNQGVAAARNRGIAEAKTDFVTCLDADDMIAPNFVETLLPVLQKKRNLGIVYGGLKMIGENDEYRGQTGFPPEFDMRVQITPHVPPSNCIPSACMFRKAMWERAGAIQQKYAPGEDAEFWVRGLSVGFDALRVTDEPIFLYRLHDGSASRTKKYVPIWDEMPWMITGDYPAGLWLPREKTKILSYIRPLVSVIIPVGVGHVKWLPRALNSLVGQKFRDWEVVVVDDTGGEFDAEQKSFTAYPFIRLVKTPGKKGAGYARNRGLEAAKGQLCLFLDADDYLLSDALYQMVEKYSTSGGRYVYTDWFDARKNSHSCNEYNQHEFMLQHGVTVLMTTADALSLMFDESLETWEEWDFFIRAAIRGICGVRLNAPLFVYDTTTSTRRVLAIFGNGKTALGDKIESKLKRKYLKYFQGEEKMSGCCGGSTAKKVTIIAGNALENTGALITNPDTGAVRMEFIGENSGAITFPGKRGSGRIYRGGNNITNKYADVHPEDVDVLEETGRWRRVRLPPKPPEPPFEESAPEQKDGEYDRSAEIAFDAETVHAKSAPKTEPIREEGKTGLKPVVQRRRRRT